MKKKIVTFAIAGIFVIAVSVMLQSIHKANAEKKENEHSSYSQDQGLENSQNDESENEGSKMGGGDENEKKFENSSGDFFDSVSNLNPNASTPESLSVSPEGHIKMTNATVNSVASSTLQVSIWGLNFNVDLSHASVLSGRQTLSASEIKVGDKLLVSGSYDKTSATVTADKVIDRSQQRQNVSDIQAKIDQLLQLIQSLQAQLNGLKP